MVCNNHSKLVGNACQEYVRFCSCVIICLSSGDTHVSFEMVNDPRHDCPYLVERIPFIRILLDTGEHAGIYVVVSISGTPLFAVL